LKRKKRDGNLKQKEKILDQLVKKETFRFALKVQNLENQSQIPEETVVSPAGKNR